MKNTIIKILLTLMGFDWQEKHCFRETGTTNTFWSWINEPPSDKHGYIGKGIIAEKY